MKITRTGSGYRMNLSAQDTQNWARKPGACWPCSTLSGRAVFVDVDSNGLCDTNLWVRHDIDSNELEALVSDHLPDDLRKYWPVWA